MSLGRHPVSDLHVGDELADFDDFPGELMANDERRFASAARPVIPLVDVHVSAADTGATHLDQDLVVQNRRHRNIGQLEAGTSVMFDERLHEVDKLTSCKARYAGTRPRRKIAQCGSAEKGMSAKLPLTLFNSTTPKLINS